MLRRSGDRYKPPRKFPAELLAEAARNPNGSVCAIRPGVDPNGAVPPEDIIGAWSVGPDGKPTGKFIPNPKFRLD